VAFYHAQAGGCCDCGDPDAWDPRGFCDLHGGGGGGLGSGGLGDNVEMRGWGVVRGCMDWLVQVCHVVENDDEKEEREKILSCVRSGEGLWVVLHSDDVHSNSEIAMALSDVYMGLSREALLSRIIRLLKLHGDLVLYGPAEAAAEVGQIVAACWKDGDSVATDKVARLYFEKKRLLRRAGLVVRLKTLKELVLEHRCVAVISFLSTLARSCDNLCQVVAQAMDGTDHLIPLLRSDLRLSKKITSAWHALLLTLLAVPALKANLAGAYCDIYSVVTKEYASGVGVLDCSLFTLSVQFLNRQTYVMELAGNRFLLERLVGSLLQMLRTSIANATDAKASSLFQSSSINFNLNPLHPVLTHRRYSPCISDLKCVLNVKGMARVFCGRPQCLNDWIETLRVCQGMDSQIWRSWSQGHVETEPRGWVGAFNASISLGSLFERILAWDDGDVCPVPTPAPLQSCAEITKLVLRGLASWQKSVMIMSGEYAHTSNTSTLPTHARTPASLPFTTISVQQGGLALALRSLPVSQITPWSFHYPLHRFAAACLREVTRRVDGLDQLSSILSKEAFSSSSTNVSRSQNGGGDDDDIGDDIVDDGNSDENNDWDILFRGMMEFPLLVLSRSAQIRAGLWKRNGAGMQDQVLNYAEPPFCRALRDADLLLLQYSLLHAPESTATFLNLALHRFGIFDFAGFAKAPNSDINLYRKEVTMGLYPGEDVAWKNDHLDLYALPPLALPWTYTPARGDTLSSLTLLEEFLHLLIVLVTELPPAPSMSPITDAKLRLRREVVHRLASGPRTHSELVEVHHVLPQRDNARLSEEGKMMNPDDATGAALEETLAQVAELKPSKTFGPNQWVLKKDVWREYDPAFFHVGLRCHESATAARPSVTGGAYAPRPPAAHWKFSPIRKNLACDASLMALCYRVLHVHLTTNLKEVGDLRGKSAYEKEALSETALARTVHFLTLALYAFLDDVRDGGQGSEGGTQPGSLFYTQETVTLENYIDKVFISPPNVLMDCEWYKNDDCAITLLRRLAWDGSVFRDGSFTAQDASVKNGAKWICDVCYTHSDKAKQLLGDSGSDKPQQEDANQRSNSAELQRRKEAAKKRAMKEMLDRINKFAEAMEDEEEFNNLDTLTEDGNNDESMAPPPPSFLPPQSLLKERPRCIICSDDPQTMQSSDSPVLHAGDNATPSSKQHAPLIPRTSTTLTPAPSTNMALAFCGFAQASTVLKGGGGPPQLSPQSPSYARFVGTHVALCGHAVHTACCDAYLASVAQRDSVDRLEGGRRGEFRCPLCQRLSNVLIPFIDVGVDWVEQQRKENDREARLGLWMKETKWGDDTGWDGRCCFYNSARDTAKDDGDYNDNADANTNHSSNNISTASPFKKTMSFGKKDLVAAWNNVMRTPRFRRTASLAHHYHHHVSSASSSSSSRTHTPPPSNEKTTSSGVTEVWRRLMDQISDVSHRADWKRLGEDELIKDYGEFRHYLVEKSVYNADNRRDGRETVEWPNCITRSLTEVQKNELSREKLISKLLLSIQSFTYSVTAEAADIRRLNRKHPLNTSFYSKYGVQDVCCFNQLILLPDALPNVDDGEQVFEGRMGKLRYFGLSVMAASSAVSREIVQLVLFGQQHGQHQRQRHTSQDLMALSRAPIVFPLLCGHILTHVTVAMCATCGKGRFKSNLMDGAAPGGACSGGEMDTLEDEMPFVSEENETAAASVVMNDNETTVTDDCDNFIKLGLLARVLQVLLGSLGVMDDFGRATKVLDMVDFVTKQNANDNDVMTDDSSPDGSAVWEETQWRKDCCELLRVALSSSLNNVKPPSKESTAAASDQALLDCFETVTKQAFGIAISFLADAALILQILVPGVVNDSSRQHKMHHKDKMQQSLSLKSLAQWLKIEPLSVMLSSNHVRRLIMSWYNDSQFNATPISMPQQEVQNDSSSSQVLRLRQKLYCKRQSRVLDWPMAASSSSDEQARVFDGLHVTSGVVTSPLAAALPTGYDLPLDPDHSSQMIYAAVSSPCNNSLSTSTTRHQQDLIFHQQHQEQTIRSGPMSNNININTNLPIHSSKKCVPLLGGYWSSISSSQQQQNPNNSPSSSPTRIKVLPTSYTDLYAELSLLCPDSEQTALCLICGEVLNAGGKSECTKHAVKCGAGCGIFFLLQECLGLIMHGGKAAYVHSPYVDSHGETPQYRGRPLNLDEDRYDILKEMWAGHLVRERVIAERSSSRQVIIPSFY